MSDRASSLGNQGTLDLLDLPTHPWRNIGQHLLGGAWQRVKDVVKRPFYALYLRRLRRKAHTWEHPRHLGIIMDGNRRFARETGIVNTLLGHRHGAEKLYEMLQWCGDVGVPVVTAWCFSIDNFKRSAEEVEGLLQLFEEKAREMRESDEVHKRQVRVRFIGRLDLLPESLQEEIRRVEEATANYDRLTLNVAMAYGGREEIADGFRNYVRERREAGDELEAILEGLDAASLEPHLYTSGQPDPDLILRTSGEVRLSGFLLWQSCHSEFYFCDTNWPAFREIDFLRALRSYHDRQRRYGR